jgi:hypothetical protein
LCWCGVGYACSSPETELVDVGTLEIRGPRDNRQRTCVAGHRCDLDRITGHHLSERDRVILLDTCGAAI